MAGLPTFVKLVEVGPRDGLQNEPSAVSVADRVALIDKLSSTGLTSIELKWGDAHVDTDPYGRGKVARYFLAESSKGAVVLPVNPELGRPEHHEHRWLTYDDAVPLLVERVRKVLDWAMVRIDGTGSS